MTQTTSLDCRGLVCPEPVLRTARAARQLAQSGGVVEVIADDDAFPADVQSWCRSAGVTLLSLEDNDNAHRALIRVHGRGASATASSHGVSAPPANSNHAMLDCRGKQCPEPVLALARFARANAGAEVVVLADDPAFSADVEAWCRSVGASELSRDRVGDALRVHIRLANRGAPSVPSASVATSAAAPVSAQISSPTLPAPERTTNAMIGPSPTPSARFDLRAMSPAAAQAEASRLSTLGSSLTVEVLLPNGDTAQAVLRTFAAAGHEIQSLDMSAARVSARLCGQGTSSSTALVAQPQMLARSASNDCTILVVHNDLENLLAAFIIANGAAAAGQRVMMFFTFWGLNVLRGEEPNTAAPGGRASFVQRMFKWMMPKGLRQPLGQYNFGGVGPRLLGSIMRGQKLTELPSLVGHASELGVRFVACTMSMSVMGLSKRDFHPYPNLEFAGVASFVDAARTSGMNFVF